MVEGVKRIYEAMFVVDSGAASSDWDGVVATINTIMRRNEADVISVRKWDDRRLAYDISGHRRGMYVLSYFNADPDRIGGIERDVRLNESILRVMVLRGDHVTEEGMNADTPALRVEARRESSADGSEESAAVVGAGAGAVGTATAGVTDSGDGAQGEQEDRPVEAADSGETAGTTAEDDGAEAADAAEPKIPE